MFSVAQGVLIKLKCTLTAQENSKRYVFRKKEDIYIILPFEHYFTWSIYFFILL